MSAYVFWGDFGTVLDRFTAAGDLSRILDAPQAETYFQQRKGPALLFLTEEIARAHAAELTRWALAHPSISLVLAYGASDTQESLTWLKTVPVIDHLIPLGSETLKNLVERLVSPEGRQKFDDNPQIFFRPGQLDDATTITLRHLNECAASYRALTDYVDTLGCFSGFSELMATAASELLTNAFYNGKRDPVTGLAKTSDRQVKFGLDGDEKVTFTFGREGKFLWMIVRDCFGSLDRGTLINAMNRAARERTAKTASTGGAGLGLMMLYEWASELGFSLESGRATTVACKFKITHRQREFQSESSSVHVHAE